jgi:hypothetical protein
MKIMYKLKVTDRANLLTYQKMECSETGPVMLTADMVEELERTLPGVFQVGMACGDCLDLLGAISKEAHRAFCDAHGNPFGDVYEVGVDMPQLLSVVIAA